MMSCRLTFKTAELNSTGTGRGAESSNLRHWRGSGLPTLRQRPCYASKVSVSESDLDVTISFSLIQSSMAFAE